MATCNDRSRQERSQEQKLVHQLLKAVDDGALLLVQQLLLDTRVNVNGSNRHGETPLHIAAGYGKLELVRLLQKAGARLNITDKQGDTPIYWAARHGHCEVVEYMCVNNVRKDHQNKAGETVTHVASRYGFHDVVSILCRYGANGNLHDNDGDTPLFCACWHGFQSIVEYLVESNSSTSVTNHDGDTPLHVAAVRGYFAIVKYLCESGADTNATNKDKRTPLHLATRRNRLDIVQFLSKKNCIPDMKDEDGETALHHACRDGHLSILHILQSHCNLNLTNKFGSTALHLASENGHSDIVRWLCASGCDLDTVNIFGMTAFDVACSFGHTELAEMLNQFKQDGYRDQCITDLAQNSLQLNRIKLLVCGASGVGKTSLVQSLKSSFIQSLLHHSSSQSANTTSSTKGFSVTQTTISSSGQFSIWDFSGQKDYYPAHECFLGCDNSIYILVFNGLHSQQKQLAQLRFWLAFIKSKHGPNEPIHYAGRSTGRPYVLLVASYADHLSSHLDLSSLDEVSKHSPTILTNSCLSQSSSFSKSKEVLHQLVAEFGHFFAIPDTVFAVDCRSCRNKEMKALRSLLGTLRETIVKDIPFVPQLATVMLQAFPSWRKELKPFPVLNWKEYLYRTQKLINPLVSEDQLRAVTSALDNSGEIIYVSKGHISQLVILDPDWFGHRVIGSALSLRHSDDTQLKSVTGCVTLKEIKQTFPELEPQSVVNLLLHFELCQPIPNSLDIQFPYCIEKESLFGMWEKDPCFQVYSGLQICCTSTAYLFSPGLFSRVQFQVRSVFSIDIDDQDLHVILWSNGLKFCRGDVEVYVTQSLSDHIIELCVRGSEDTRVECAVLFQQFYSIITTVIRESNPGTLFTTKFLSPNDLQQHIYPPHSYSAMEIFNAERSSSSLRQAFNQAEPEQLSNIMCCGNEDFISLIQLAPHTSISNVANQTRIELSRMLDPSDRFGRDWCLLALQLGLQDVVSAIDSTDDLRSPTDRLLSAWQTNANKSVAMLVDALNHIGREDIAMKLVDGISLFGSPSNTAVSGSTNSLGLSPIC